LGNQRRVSNSSRVPYNFHQKSFHHSQNWQRISAFKRLAWPKYSKFDNLNLRVQQHSTFYPASHQANNKVWRRKSRPSNFLFSNPRVLNVGSQREARDKHFQFSNVQDKGKSKLLPDPAPPKAMLPWTSCKVCGLQGHSAFQCTAQWKPIRVSITDWSQMRQPTIKSRLSRL
jgi:hypothetical protein